MKYKVWDKQNKKWAEKGMAIDSDGVLWHIDHFEPILVNDKENYVVCMGFKFSNTWIYEGDKVHFDLIELDEEHPFMKNQRGLVTLSESGFLSFGNWQAQYCRNIKIVGNQYTD